MVQIIGITKSDVIKTGRELRLIKIIAINMNDATGVALTALISGVIRTFTNEIFVVITARIIPITSATIIPKRIRKSDCEIMSQNSDVFISPTVLDMTFSGEGIRKELFVLYEAKAHTHTQKIILSQTTIVPHFIGC